MGVVSDSKTKVSREASPGSSATYSPAPISLIIESERSGNLSGSVFFSSSKTRPALLRPDHEEA